MEAELVTDHTTTSFPEYCRPGRLAALTSVSPTGMTRAGPPRGAEGPAPATRACEHGAARAHTEQPSPGISIMSLQACYLLLFPCIESLSCGAHGTWWSLSGPNPLPPCAPRRDLVELEWPCQPPPPVRPPPARPPLAPPMTIKQYALKNGQPRALTCPLRMRFSLTRRLRGVIKVRPVQRVANLPHLTTTPPRPLPPPPLQQQHPTLIRPIHCIYDHIETEPIYSCATAP